MPFVLITTRDRSGDRGNIDPTSKETGVPRPLYTHAIAALAGLALTAAAPAFAQDSMPVPVDHVDLDRYVGTWFEIMKIPNFFQKQCIRGTTATYTPNEDGTIEVVNRCIDEDGEPVEAKGVAEVVDLQSNAKLRVSFVSVFGKSMFWGDYWVIGLGEDYDYAIVGTGNREYGWVLSRTPELTYEQAEEAFWTLSQQGYDRDDFLVTDHGSGD